MKITPQWKAKKTLAMYELEMQRSGLKRELNKWSLTALGNRVCYWSWYFCYDWPGGKRIRWASIGNFIYHCRAGLHLCSLMLCRVCFHYPCGRIRLCLIV